MPPTPEQEDDRRLSRELANLLRERIQHVNRIKGLLAGQGITGYDPLRKDRRTRLDGLMTGDGRPLPGHQPYLIVIEFHYLSRGIRIGCLYVHQRIKDFRLPVGRDRSI